MRYIYNRKYPITHQKKCPDSEEKVINLSIAAAAGILLFVFAKGVYCGYSIKKMLSK